MKTWSFLVLGLFVGFAQLPAQVPTSGLVAHYVFNGNANDITGHGYDGTNNGAVPDTGMGGVPSGAYRFFQGTNIALPNNFKFSSMTFSAWINTDQTTSTGTIFEEYVDATHCMALVQVHANDCIGLWLRNGAISFQWSVNSPTGSAPKGKWHFVSFVIDSAANQVSLFVDSIAATPVSMNGHTLTSLSALAYTTIGKAYYNSSDYFNGRIENVRVFNRALSNAEVGALYHAESVTSVDINSMSSPTIIHLEQNYPNPFNPTTVIRYQLPVASMVKLVVYDLLGCEVSVLVDERKQLGSYEIKFDGSNCASGVYLYRLTAGTFIQTRKLLLLK